MTDTSNTHHEQGSTTEAQELLEQRDSEFRVRQYIGRMAVIVTFIAVLWSVFQLYVSSVGVLDAIKLRAWHIIFLLTMTFLLYPAFKKENKSRRLPTVWDIVCILLSAASFGYLLFIYDDLAMRGGYLTLTEYVFGAIGILMVFEAARRVVGNLAVLAALFLVYNFGFVGRWFPGNFGHSGFSWERIVDHMFWGSQGILGIGISVSATFVFLFILFGAFLRISGFSQFINDLALTIAGRSPGGPAKVAVLASSLMGMVNGSALANVATTGAITIPLMKDNGYKAKFAAAVEAVASTGGQFAPPIMGAAGFIMAEFLGVPYTTVMLAAIIPAFLYYAALLMAVHFEAKKLGLKGISKENIPDALQVIKRQGHLILPLIVLLVLLFMGYTPLYAAVFSILATVIASWLRPSTRMGFKDIVQALEEGAKGAVGVGVACAVIGIIIGTVSLTGLGLNFGYSILQFVGENLFLAAFFVMLISIILGMGVPGVAAYVIVATVSAPVLLDLGVNPLAAHMFVLIYACLSNITPPVALSSYVAAGIAGANQTQVSLLAIKLGLTGFIIPFFFIYQPILLLEGGNGWQILFAAVTATIGAVSLASALQGWLLDKCHWIQRVLLLLIAYFMIDASILMDVLGVGILIGIIIWQKLQMPSNQYQKRGI